STKERAKSYMAGCLGKLANEAVSKREFDEAKDFLSQATELRPGFADLWQLRSRVHFILGETDLAQEAIDEALRINPGYTAGLFMSGLIAYKEGDREDGFAAMSQAVHSDQRLDGAEWKAGEKYHSDLNFAEALDEFKQVKPAASNVSDLIAAGDALAKDGTWIQARDMYLQALEIAPTFADVLCRYGQSLFELNEVEQAEKQFSKACEVNPNFAEARALRGVALRRMGCEEEAVEAFKECLKIDPNHPIAMTEVQYRRA
ncbi:MAG: tetratricopeptide repeat protein, partial [Fimbriimonadaceae bacterium]